MRERGLIGLKTVRDSLLAPSETVVGSSLPRVTPFDPTKSFVLDKVTGTENDRGYRCQSQDASEPLPCGGPMPKGGSSLCVQSSDSALAIAQWIRQGAPQN